MGYVKHNNKKKGTVKKRSRNEKNPVRKVESKNIPYMQVLNKTGTIKRFIPVRNPGWRNHPVEHSLASRGIKTANNNEPLHVELYMEPENMSHSDIDRLYEYREPEDIINDWNKLHDDSSQ
jgi:hypothetical protein